MQIIRKLRRSDDCSGSLSCLNQNVAFTFCGVESIALVTTQALRVTGARGWKRTIPVGVPTPPPAGHGSNDVIVEFTDERRAVTFERYLKSGSGVAFSKRHLR